MKPSISFCTAAFAAALTVNAMPAPAAAALRTYYIAADEVVWNYAPSGRDEISGGKLPPLAPLALGWSYRKVVYRGYTGADFTKLSQQPAYLGLIGPVIRAEVGDTIRVVFKNNARVPADIQPRGVLASTAGHVAPGAVHTYSWAVPERAGPGPNDGSSIVWPYGSNVAESRDENTGMIGPLVVTRAGHAKPDGTPADVDQEVFALFSEMDESQSRLLAKNLADRRVNPRKIKSGGPAFSGSNQFYNINGFVFGNMPMPVVRRGQHVRWYLLSSGSDYDFHTPHWHGQTTIVNGMRSDVVQLNETNMTVADMVPDNPGIWLFHCHVNVHLDLGMEARFRVLP